MNGKFIIVLAGLLAMGLACQDPKPDADILQPEINEALSGFDTDANLRVYVDADTVNTRSDLRFSMGACNISAIKEITDPDPLCRERYMLNLSWADWRSCGMAKNYNTSTPKEDHYGGILVIKFDEKAGEVAGKIFYRTVTNQALLTVILQREVQATSELVRVYAPPDVDSALLDVKVKVLGLDPDQPGHVDFSVITGVQNPFKLKILSVRALAPWDVWHWDWLPFPIWSDTDAQGYRQEWHATLFPLKCPRKVCKLDGQRVMLNFSISCQNRTDPYCPIHLDDIKRVAMEVKIYTSDWCSKFVGDATLDANMASYTNTTFAIPTSAFFINEKAYFMAKIFSTAGLSFASVEIRWVNCTGSAVIAPYQLVHTLPSFHSILSIPDRPKFWWLLDDALFKADDRSWNELKVKARFRVTYSAKKRGVQDGPQEFELENSLQLNKPQGAGASTLSPFSFFTL